MAISEKIELLGKSCYKGKNIPDVLTLKSLPTASELDVVSSEDFDKVMIETILPQCVEEKIDFYQLLEVDYQWLLRCLRILNYGPYHTTNRIYCQECGTQDGEFIIDLQNVECKTIPDTFDGTAIINRNEFLDFKGDVKLHMLTIRETLTAMKDPQFKTASKAFARLCYMVNEIAGTAGLTPIEVKIKIQSDFTPSDYIIMERVAGKLTDYGLRAGGSTRCPKCGNKEAAFFAFVDDRYFRPTLDNLRAWKADRDGRKESNTAGSKTKDVRGNNR